MGDEPRRSIVALVTGGGKGIGLAIVKSLASQNVTTIFTSRNESQGKQVADMLDRQFQLKTYYHKLDLLDSESVTKLADWVKQEFGFIDVLVNNAGVYGVQLGEVPSFERAKRVIGTNYYGPKKMVEAFIPLFKPGGRIVNVSSAAASLGYLTGPAAAWKAKLLDAESDDIIDSFIQDFYDAEKQGSETVKLQGWAAVEIPIPGYPVDDDSDYCVSKMALTSYTLMMARKHPELLVNTMCPGLCNTDMTFHLGHSPEQGADTAVWLALECTTSGKFFVRRKEVRDLECIPVACNDELAETFERAGEMLYPVVLERAKALGLV